MPQPELYSQLTLLVALEQKNTVKCCQHRQELVQFLWVQVSKWLLR